MKYQNKQVYSNDKIKNKKTSLKKKIKIAKKIIVIECGWYRASLKCCNEMSQESKNIFYFIII